MTEIKQVAILGSGTMGLGIAAVCANAGCKVLLLDLNKESCDAALPKLSAGRSPVITNEQTLSNISTGSFESDMEKIAECQWICEVVIENLNIKRKVFLDIEKHRSNGSIVSTNTSGIPLKDIYSGMPMRLQEDIAVTHFFNPAHIMRLVELVAGENTKPEVITSLAHFLGKTLDKGVVYAKDTVNFIGNRIGCTWINTGIHLSEESIKNDGLTVEVVDALLGEPIGLPATGLYALIDLIGIDVMRNVNLNMGKNLPENDFGRQYVTLTSSFQDMYDRGQLGRKAGGGFYKLNRHEDGTKSMEIFDITTNQWRDENPITLSEKESSFQSLFSLDNHRGRLVQNLMAATLCYSADLVPEISNDIVNVDRAMRWGFGWQRGPFQLIDEIGAALLIDHIKQRGNNLPHMLQVMVDSNETQFYRKNKTEFLTVKGSWATVPEE